MKQFLFAVDTLSTSTAACERGFSQMNIICSPSRTQLTVSHQSSLLFLAMVGPPINRFDPTPYDNSRLTSGRHATTQTWGMPRKRKDDTGEPSQVALWKIF